MTVKKFAATELTNSQYHSDTSKLTDSQFPHLSSSGMKKLIESPAAFKEIYIDGFSTGGSSAMDLGSYVHALILEPHKVAEEFVIWRGARRAGKEWEEFQFFNKGKTIIREQDHDLAQKMLRAFYDSKHATSLIDKHNGEAEVSFLGDFDGIPVKVRCDWLRHVAYPGDPNQSGAVVDIKTTSAPLNDEEVAATIHKYSYELSTALYLDLLEQFDGKKRSFYFVFISKHGDCACRVWRASDKLIELGRKKYKRALDMYRDCILHGFDRTGEPDEIPTITPPLHLYGDYGR